MKLMLFAPELFLLLGSLVLFLLSTGKVGGKKARAVTLGLALFNVLVCLVCLPLEGSLFYEAYRIDFFSQLIKLIMASGGVVAGIACFLNRSLTVDDWYTVVDGAPPWNIPVVSLVRKPINEWRQDDPAVKEDIAKGNVVWKPKDEWGRLKKAMQV